MITDEERSEIAARIRGIWGEQPGRELECALWDALFQSSYRCSEDCESCLAATLGFLAELVEPEKRECIRCGKEYEPKNHDQKYCSRHCKRMHYVERRMAEDDLPYWMARVHGLCGNDEGGAND